MAFPDFRRLHLHLQAAMSLVLVFGIMQVHAELDTSRIPAPVFESEPGYVDLYWKAWELAGEHIREDDGMPQSPFMHSGRDPSKISLWESCFTALFTKYAPNLFPGIQTLDNFYAMIHDGEEGSLPVEHPDNPPILAWAEWEHFKMTGDTARLKWLVRENEYLQKHFQYFHDLHAVWDEWQRTYGWTAEASGMINTPRLRSMPVNHSEICEGGGHAWTCEEPPEPEWTDGTNFRWADATMQQCLSALCISRIAGAIGATALETEYEAKHAEWVDAMNSGNYKFNGPDYWDTRGALVNGGGTSPVKPRTVDRFWVFLSEAPDSTRGPKLMHTLTLPHILGGPVPFPSVNLADIDADFDGRLWRGSMFPAMAYMGVKAVEKYGSGRRADEYARRIVHHMYRTFVDFQPHTIWEAYSPTRRMPATDTSGVDLVNADYCGWSGVGPISLFIEHVLGFHEIDASNRRVSWRLHWPDKHGIKRLTFGPVVTDILYENGAVTATTNEAYTLAINGEEHDIPAGDPVTIDVAAPAAPETLPPLVRYPVGEGIRVEAEGVVEYPVNTETSSYEHLCEWPWRFICECSQGWKIWVDNMDLPPMPRGNALLFRLAYGGSPDNPVQWSVHVNGEHHSAHEGYGGEWQYLLLHDVPLTEETNTVSVQRASVNYFSMDYVEVLTLDSAANAANRTEAPQSNLRAENILRPTRTGLVLSLPQSGMTTVDIIDLSGRHVARLARRTMQTGMHRLHLPKRIRGSGRVYVVRLKVGDLAYAGMVISR